MKKIPISLLIFFLLAPQIILAQEVPPPPERVPTEIEEIKPVSFEPGEEEKREVPPEIAALEKELEKDSENPIIQTQLKMVRLKLEKTGAVIEEPWQRRWRRHSTGINRDLYGGFLLMSDSDFDEGLDILTGEKAIDESLQLGSINSNRRDTSTGTDLFDINEIKPVQIKSHPWEQMLGDKEFKIPEITKLIPKDTLFAYLENPEKYLDLEKVMTEILDTFGKDFYTFGKMASFKPVILERLGLPKKDFLVHTISEMAFVSSDLDFVPGNDYALIMKFKTPAFEESFNLLLKNATISEKLGEYTVVTTHKDFLQEIKNTYEDEMLSMNNEKDFHYALSVLEQRRDGFVYLSESFIRKLTGPKYRINARRRNTVINALENLQYITYAYRRITGEWPADFQQIINEGYIQEDIIYEAEKYSIDAEGRVSHEDWENIWNMKPINQVPIDKITQGEKEIYESFEEEYQSYFREFFDPIGISFTVSDQILFHTIILPLIDESEYNFVKSVFGSNEELLTNIFSPDRFGVINMNAGFSIDNLLFEMNNSGRNRDEDEENISQEAIIAEAEKEIAEELEIELKEGERLLDFFGNEIFFGAGAKNSFNFNNIADIDLWLGMKITDQDKSKTFLKKVFAQIGKDMGGRNSFGIFSVSTTEPITNTYNDVEYFLIPTGFINLYYVFLDDTMYVTISQIAINRLIDSKKEIPSLDNYEHLKRGFAFVGDDHNIAGNIDFNALSEWDSKILEEELKNENSYEIEYAFGERKAYLLEAMTLAKTLPEFDGTLKNVESYYLNIPTEFLGGEFEIDTGNISLQAKDEKHNIYDVDTHRNYNPYDYLSSEEENNDKKEIKSSDLLESSMNIEDIKIKLKSFRSGSIGVKFTEDGLDIRLAFGNPLQEEKDDRFSFQSEKFSQNGLTKNLPLNLFISLVGLILVVGGFFLFLKKRN